MKAARDPARPIEPDVPVEEASSMAAVVCGQGPPGPRQLPLVALSFAELHTALGNVHTVSTVPPVPEGRLGQ
jgi:hypothetical protein